MQYVIPSDSRLLRLANALELGAGADIWYDAEIYFEGQSKDEPNDTQRLIEQTQGAMVEAAQILRRLASEG